jgi:carbonic anhydrase
MTEETMLVGRHQDFEAQFASGDLAIPPRLPIVVLTCVDARVDPAHLFSLELGDALVIRNTGGRVTSGVVNDLAILSVLSAGWPGDNKLELAVIQHTGCGMARLTQPDTQQQVAARLGLAAAEVSAMAISDPAVSVRQDIEQLRSTHSLSDELVVSGFVYNVTDGSLTQVVPPGPLRIPT